VFARIALAQRLFRNVAGYSRLIGADEAGTLARLNESVYLRRTVV
jgi:hypothetical protein